MNDKEYLLSLSHFTTEDLMTLMSVLRAKDGCPWDSVQTHRSIRNDFLEEAYEAVEGIDTGDPELLCEELGDVLLQVAFHSSIAQDEGEFTYQDVVDGVCRKMIERHPHVFTDLKAGSEEELKAQWNTIKASTKHRDTLAEDLDSIAKTLPALIRAQKTVKRLVSYGKASLPGVKMTKEELGDALFSLCAVARASGLDAEEALTAKCAAVLEEARKRTNKKEKKPTDKAVSVGFSVQMVSALSDVFALGKRDVTCSAHARRHITRRRRTSRAKRISRSVQRDTSFYLHAPTSVSPAFSTEAT